jgi:hypothetical protein
MNLTEPPKPNYQRWVSDSDGNLFQQQVTYCIYKEHKCEYYNDQWASKGKNPSRDKVNDWVTTTAFPHRSKYQDEAKKRIDAFTLSIIQGHTREIELKVRAELKHSYRSGIGQNLWANVIWSLLVTVLFVVLSYSGVPIKEFLKGLVEGLPH